MKKILTCLLISACFACDEDALYQPEGFEGIVSSDGSSLLSEIVFTLDLTYQDSLYLLSDSLFSLEIYLNNREWGTFTSTPIDTTAFRSVRRDGSLLSLYPVEYLFVTNSPSSIDTLETAGDYSRALRELLSLSPGDYVAEIRSVSWVNAEGETVQRPIRDVIPFTLTEDTESLYLGNFTSSVRL